MESYLWYRYNEYSWYSDKGYILEVDLSYLWYLHNLPSDFPSAPKTRIGDEKLPTGSKVKDLIATLEPKNTT